MTRTALGAAAACLAAAALATPAQAGIITKSAADCGTPQLTQPFKPWLDFAHYKLVDNGAFEDGTEGWTLTGGARVVNGNATQRVQRLGRHEVAPAAGRFDGHHAAGLRRAQRADPALLRPQEQRTALDADGVGAGPARAGRRVGDAPGRRRPRAAKWHPSLPHLVLANLLPLLPPDMTAVRFKFAPILGGEWQIDDVYVDPRGAFVGTIVPGGDRSARTLA